MFRFFVRALLSNFLFSVFLWKYELSFSLHTSVLPFFVLVVSLCYILPNTFDIVVRCVFVCFVFQPTRRDGGGADGRVWFMRGKELF